jgi:hypothetical protein
LTTSVVTSAGDVLASTEYYAAIRCQSCACADGLGLCGSDGFGAYGKQRSGLLSPEWETPLHVRHDKDIQ